MADDVTKIEKKTVEVLEREKRETAEAALKPEALKTVGGEMKEKSEVPVTFPPSALMVPPQEAVPKKSDDLQQIEHILEEDIAPFYLQMPRDAQLKFKQEGEKAAFKIERMIHEAKTQARKILQWILDWLKMIPGVNRFFLEQEAKIKTDKIMAFYEERKRKYRR